MALALRRPYRVSPSAFRKRDAGDFGFFRQDLFDHINGHMTTDHITPDKGRMASLKIFRNTGITADLHKILGWFDVYFKAIFTQVIGIALATTALWVFVERV